MIHPLILDVGSENILSQKNIILKKTSKICISCLEEDIKNSTHIFLPGVGSFSAVMKKFKKKINTEFLKKHILERKVFLLGICVGMQIMSDEGDENGLQKGLSWINGKVEKIPTKEILPHVGWNSIDIKTKDPIIDGIPNLSDFYFTHSYCFNITNDENIITTSNYGFDFPSIIKRNNIYGVQFNPEKSQGEGEKLIENFLGLK